MNVRIFFVGIVSNEALLKIIKRRSNSTSESSVPSYIRQLVLLEQIIKRVPNLCSGFIVRTVKTLRVCSHTSMLLVSGSDIFFIRSFFLVAIINLIILYCPVLVFVFLNWLYSTVMNFLIFLMTVL
jgi:hypothetical protein